MSTTPRGSPELTLAQAVPETTVNEQIRRTEAGSGRFPVADRVTAPPGTCADGANYIIIATATGAFTGKEDQIATAVGTNASNGWYYRVLGTIDEGILAYVQDEDQEYKWSGSAWATYTGAGVGSTASTTEQLTGTDSSKAATPDSVAALWEQGTDVASAGTISLGEGGYFKITGTTTITDIDFATDKAGRTAWIRFAGALTLTHNSSTLILPTGANITTAAGDVACFVSEGSDVVRCVSYQRASGQALAASTSFATSSDINTGTDTTKAINSDALAGSNFGTRTVSILVSDPAGSAITTGDGKAYWRVPSTFNGMNLVAVAGALTTVSSSGIPTVQIANVTDSVDMLSTKLTIDANETDSSTAATAAVIDTSHDDVATGDMLRIDIDVAGTGAKGLIVEMQFQLP